MMGLMVTYRPMARKPVRGLFITGTDTEIGKTYVAALIARSLVAAGHRVGVYKPAASGCSRQGDSLVSDDALALWQAAGSPGTLAEVCPQVFAAPLAPHLAAAAEGKQTRRRPCCAAGSTSGSSAPTSCWSKGPAG